MKEIGAMFRFIGPAGMFYTPGRIYTIQAVYDDNSITMSDDHNEGDHWWTYGDKDFTECFVYVGEEISSGTSPTTNPFLKTVTETKIVGGRHTFYEGAYLDLEIEDDAVYLQFPSVSLNKEELKELARILSEIAEAM